MNNPTQRVASMVPAPSMLQAAEERSIGALLVDAGKIRPEDAERILSYAKERSIRFGDAAVALRLATENDIQLVLARQFAYPYLVPGQSNVMPEVIAAWTPFNPQVESLRALRSQLLLRWFVGDASQRSLAIVGANRGDGRSHMAANLAVVFSQMGERTLLIDADLRHPRQHEMFGLPNSVGLSSVLAERAGVNAIQRVPGFVDLSVLASGPTPPNPSELLGRSAFTEVLADLEKSFDIIIIDTPAAVLGSDYQLIAQRAKAALVIARKNRTSMDDCADIGNALRAAGSVVVGGVLNEF